MLPAAFNFKTIDPDLLAHRVTQTRAKLLDPRTEGNPKHFSGKELEAGQRRLERPHRARVLKPKHDNALALRTACFQELQATAKGAGVSGLRVENVFRPVLSGSAVVSEGTHGLELDRPFVRDE